MRVSESRRMCQANVKDLPHRKGMRSENTASSYTLMQFSIKYFNYVSNIASTVPLYKEEKHMDESRNNICSVGGNYCHKK